MEKGGSSAFVGIMQMQWPNRLPLKPFLFRLQSLNGLEVTRFEFISSSSAMLDTKKAVTFYRPVGVPESFHILGHYCQPSGKPLHGFVLVAREVETCFSENADICNQDKLPPLKNPLDF
ncbi:hypothetical protein JHK82_032549 [Glycine max]|nr:hypothetical protein JHK85_033259 [Glycine max]KAG5118129.1 hypothetical protein JHK82_032549 [Glycine max]